MERGHREGPVRGWGGSAGSGRGEAGREGTPPPAQISNQTRGISEARDDAPPASQLRRVNTQQSPSQPINPSHPAFHLSPWKRACRIHPCVSRTQVEDAPQLLP